MAAMTPWNVLKLQDELAEARAQIAAKDAALDQLRLELDRAGELIDADLLARCVKAEDTNLTNEVLELRAQIAAKDAALREIAEFPYHGMQASQAMQGKAKAALAMPAREPE